MYGRRGGSNADMRTKGYKYCTYVIQATIAEAKEYSNGKRNGVRYKGKRCAMLCTPDQISRNIVPICHHHEELFRNDMKEAEKLRLSLRAKYDPGPLPL